MPGYPINKLNLSAVFLLFLLGFPLFNNATAQTTYEDPHRSVYGFLSRLSAKGIADFSDHITPVSRKHIAEQLISIRPRLDELHPVEREEYDFYLREYGFDSPDTSSLGFQYAGKDYAGRYRLFSYHSDLFSLALDPVLALSYSSRNEKDFHSRRNGFTFIGMLGKHIGFSFSFSDNMEKGSGRDRFRRFTSEPGIVTTKYDSSSFEFSDIRASLTYDWSWGSITAAKDYFTWGYGESGKLVMSDKAPTFPYIRLDISPAPWLQFNYIHAWLSSSVLDSSRFYPTTIDYKKREVYHKKYLASHTITVTPIKGLSIFAGESVVYSDELELAYLIPVMFFRAADHFLSDENNSAGSNAQLFAGISSRNHLPNTHLYSSLFIDELSIAGLTDETKRRNQIGYSFGGSVYDLAGSRTSVTLEYTRLLPYAYSHYISTTDYESNNYPLGDWIGQNADRIYASVAFYPLRGLQAKGYYQYIRKGGEGNPIEQQLGPDPDFLSAGPIIRFTEWGFGLTYEPVHTLILSAEATIRHYPNGSFTDFRILAGYGI